MLGRVCEVCEEEQATKKTHLPGGLVVRTCEQCDKDTKKVASFAAESSCDDWKEEIKMINKKVDSSFRKFEENMKK